jgi:hypothetical protein
MSVHMVSSVKNLDAETESLAPNKRHQRTKQQLFGSVTTGYLKMRLTTENSALFPAYNCPKREFDAKVRVWRVQLHQFDKASISDKSVEDIKKVFDEVFAEISECELNEELKSNLYQSLKISSELILAEQSKTPSPKLSYTESATTVETPRSLSTSVNDDEFVERVEEFWRQNKSPSTESGNQASGLSLWDYGSIWKS